VATVTLPYPAPTNSGEYAQDLDVELGAPFPVAPATEEVTSAWVQSESPSFPGWNGLGTELDLPGAKPDPSNPHVYDYPSLQEGLQAAVDELAGGGPQTDPLAPAFVAAVRSGNATTAQLIADIQEGNPSSGESWTGKAPDTYDATAIANKLGVAGFSVAGSAATTPATATTTSFPGGALDPLNWPGEVAGSVVSTVAGSIGIYILKGVLSLMAAGLVVYGATLLTDRKGAAGPAGGALAGSAAAGPAEAPFEAFGPEDELLAAA